jgi:hydrogenase small subunit
VTIQLPSDLRASAKEPARRETLFDALLRRGVSRRQFLQFCGAMATALALPAVYGQKIARALETTPKPVVLWREFQDCAGNTESMLRTSHPDIAQIVLEELSLEYHETIMAGAGAQAEAVVDRVRTDQKGKYIAIIEGSIPTADGGVYCTIGGKTALQLVREVASDAALVIAVGDCAWDGGFVTQGPTGAVGVGQAVNGLSNLINLGGCPMNSVNTAAVIVHYLTFGQAPALDSYHRPLFAYGHLIHDQCERRAHFDAGRYVEAWGDHGHQNGWCLYKMGCKGPETTYNCPTVRWNDATSWPVKAGHGCIGCAAPNFWATMSPFYERLPHVKLVGLDVDAQTIGIGLIGAVAGASALHGAGMIVKRRRVHQREAAAAAAAGGAGGAPGEPAPEPTSEPSETED